MNDVLDKVGDLNSPATFEDAREEILEKLSTIRPVVPDDLRSAREVVAAKEAAADTVRRLRSLLESAAGAVPAQDLTFRDMASDAKYKLMALDAAIAAARAQTEGGRRRRRKTRKGKGKSRKTLRRRR